MQNINVHENKEIMFTTQDHLNILVKDYDMYKEKMKATRDGIDRYARCLLSELMEIEGWECMIKHCYEHYSSYKNKGDFFKACEVTHSDGAVQFVKGYRNGDEYEVLEISFRKSLKDQIRDRMDFLENEKRRREVDEHEKDMIELARIRYKYGL